MSTIPTTIKSKKLVEKRREQIVLAAIKLFAEKGFHKTTLRELSDEAGISHGNIYDYVGTKEDIFYLLHEYMDKLATDSLCRSIEHIEDPLEKLRRMVRSEFNLMYQWADAILIIYQECHILNKSLLRELLKRESAHVQLYEMVLKECIKKGLLVDESHSWAADTLEKVCHGITSEIPYRFFASATQVSNSGKTLLLNSIIGRNLIKIGVEQGIKDKYPSHQSISRFYERISN